MGNEYRDDTVQCTVQCITVQYKYSTGDEVCMILPNKCFDNCMFLKIRFYDDGGGHCELYDRYSTSSGLLR